MKQEDKELLLKDLCARLPYGVICKDDYINFEGRLGQINLPYKMIKLYNVEEDNDELCWAYNCKPYLFPMSSMTEEQYNEFFAYFHNIEMAEVKASGDYLKAAYLGEDAKRDWLNKNHFDYRYLIPKDLAIDATNLKIY